MKHYVYVLMNEYGIVEYVGCSKNIKDRFKFHTKWKPSLRNGKFYKRTDLELIIVKEFDSRKKAEEYEGQLKLSLGFEWVESTKANKAHQARKIVISAYHKDTLEYIGTYNSMIECARKLNLSQGNITSFFNGKKKSVNGYTFKKENI